MKIHSRYTVLSLIVLLLISINITTAQDNIVLIHDVQGAPEHPDYPDSPYEDSDVIIEGIVIGDFQDGDDGTHGDLNGFYIQEEDSDADDNPQTSEGIYVFERRGTVSNVEIGDLVQVVGTVDEIRSMTQITASEVTIISSDNLLPVPTVISLPLADRSEWEYSENMLVTVVGANEPLTVNDTYDLGRYGVTQLTADGRAYQYTQINRPSTPEAFEAYRQEVGLRVILVDDGRTNENADTAPIFNDGGFSAENTVRSGYLVEQVTGVLEFRFDEWRIQPTYPINMTTTENARPATNPDLGGTLRIASVNLLNYFNGNGQGEGFPTARGASNPEEFERQRAKTLSALALLDADIIGLIEIENDFGDGEDSAVQDLVNGLNAFPDSTSCGANWDYVDTTQAPLNLDRVGTDAIALTFMYCSTTVRIAPDTVPAILSDELLPELGLGDFVPTFNGVNTSRIPMAVTFQEIATDEVITVVINHLKAKGGDGEVEGDIDNNDGVASWNQRRLQAVIALDAWLATNPTGTEDNDILLLGDFNAYAMEDPIQYLDTVGFANLIDISDHSYGFPLILGRSPETQGWGTLDYALANASMQAQITGATVLHINADEPIYIDYNTEFKPEERADNLYLPDAYRASDHDPIVVGVSLGG